MVVIHSIAFFFIFSGTQTMSNFMAALMKDANLGKLGFVCNSITYGVFAFSSITAPAAVAALGPIKGMKIGGAAYAIYLASFLFLSELQALIASVMIGSGAGLLWVSQGEFLSRCSDEETTGVHSGLFWSIFMGNAVAGNLLGYFVVGDADVVPRSTIQAFLFCLTGSAAVGVAVLFLLPIDVSPEEEVGSRRGEQEPVCSMLGQSIMLVAEWNTVLLLPLICYSGWSAAFWTGTYPTLLGGKLSTAPTLPACFKPRVIGLAGAAVGFGEIVGGIVMGRLVDGVSVTAAVVAGATSMGSAFIAIYFIFGVAGGADFNGSFEVSLMIAFGLGLGDAGVNTSIYAFLQRVFAGRTTHGFALFRCFQSLVCCGGFALGPVLTVRQQVTALFGFLLAASFLAIVLDRRQQSVTSPARSKDWRYAKSEPLTLDHDDEALRYMYAAPLNGATVIAK